jgi:hypothetical protein
MAAIKEKKGFSQDRKGQAMKSHDTDVIGLRARRETEDFINQNINDKGAGWPVSCPFGPDYTDSQKAQQDKKGGVQKHKRSA